jgi:class 3 adenylate cyclase
MKTPHRLATILFADIQGYSAMMEHDEHKALNYIQIFQSLIEKEVIAHDGVIQNFYGDGCLISFNGSTDAVNCAVQLQNEF